MSDIEKKESETKNAAASEKADKKSEKSVQKAEKVKMVTICYRIILQLRKRIAKSFREYKSELKKIVWYSREQTFHSTIVVLVSIIVSAAVIAVVDFSFSHLITWLGSLI